jgi:virulence factor Mce-like protein
MKRILGIVAILAVGAGIFFLVAGARGGGTRADNEWKVEFDNAFGLIGGADLKIAGVRAGKLTTLEVDQRTKYAVVGFKVTEKGFGGLRSDASCAVLPQSLVGEYYVDCQPGVAKRRLKPGSTIPVERTTSTVPPDLVNNIMRRPYRERLRFIIGELGAAVSGNADNLNAALRRASPALRETNKVLAILAQQNQVLADLAENADEVVGELADNRTDVSRFVTEARQTAQISATRDREISAGFRRLPGFLRELEPTMAELGRTVDAQGPALRNLSASAGQVERLFDNLTPFAEASRPGIEALGRSADAGREAVRSATPTVAELEKYSRGVPELGKNLAIILEHLDDRSHSAEEDPRSPGGKGYTGLEALLQYTFDQTLSTNIHDGEVHILNVFPFEGQCAAYADIKAAKEKAKDCSTQLGPNVIGVNFPDATAPPGYDGADRGRQEQDPDVDPRPTRSAQRSAGGERSGAGDAGPAMKVPKLDDMLPGRPEPGQPPAPEPVPLPEKPELPDVPAPKAPEVPDTPRIDPPLTRDVPGVTLASRARREEAQTQLLEYLFGS